MIVRTALGLPVLCGALWFAPVWGQTVSSCEEQLAEATTTLAYVRASRQASEDNAGRVTATLQHRLEKALKDLEIAKKARISSPDPVKGHTEK